VNFLAHAYLSGNSDELPIGNFIADAVKGSAINAFSPVDIFYDRSLCVI